MNWQGTLAGIISGGITVIIWRLFVKTYINLYELLPAFIISVIFIVIVSLLTREPSAEIQKEYETYMKSDI
jgi:sodium/proline symporter